MKLIATLNFKGGVGKTTVTWLLARYVAQREGKKVLVIDADPQMSLTTAVTIEMESGLADVRFDDWQKESLRDKKTILHALKDYAANPGRAVSSGFNVDSHFIYQRAGNLYLLPSVEDLYWFGLEPVDAQSLRGFVPSLLHAVGEAQGLPTFDYCFVDCPPAFNALSFSVVCCADLVVIPVNADVFASKGVRIMLRGLKPRVKPLPKFCVFVNDVRPYRGNLPAFARRYLDDVAYVCQLEADVGVSVEVFRDFFIPTRAGIRDAMIHTLPEDLERCFAALWQRVEKTIG